MAGPAGWQRPKSRSDDPRPAVGIIEAPVRLVVPDEPLRLRVPGQLAAELHGDMGHDADAVRAVADFDRGGRGLPAADGLEEVLHVVAALDELDRALARLPLQDPGIGGLDAAALDEDPAVVPLEADAGRVPRFHEQPDAVRVDRFALELGVDVEQAA